MAFLGWNPGTEQEMFSLSELIQTFDIQKVNKSGAKFDPDKAKWYNQQYLVRKSDDEIVHDLRADLAKRGIETSINLSSVVRQMKERIVFVKDIYSSAQYFFESPTVFDPKTVKKKWVFNKKMKKGDLVTENDIIMKRHESDDKNLDFQMILNKKLLFDVAENSIVSLNQFM